MISRALGIMFIGLLITACSHQFTDQTEIIDLSGTWKFQLDPDKTGLDKEWFNLDFNDSILLPGTTDENKKGIFLDEQAVDRLSRVWYWKGAAWYQKDVEIPEDWAGKNVKLLLERTKDTYVWFDDVNCGYENTLSAKQFFDLTKAVKPGKHRITIRVDNEILPPVGPSHAVDERTQTNWNGIVGKLELQAFDAVYIDEIQVYPDIQNNRAKINIRIQNKTEKELEGTLTIDAKSWNTEKPLIFKGKKISINCDENKEVLEFYFDFNKKAPLWDEFDPSLIKLSFSLLVSDNGHKYSSSKEIDFGMREVTRDGKYILNNGNKIFLRGRIDCANYPITGYPPMNLEEWLRNFRLIKSYGINHWRFHSWFPPEEALTAADIVGIYLQPELPNKRSGMDKKSMEEEEVRKLKNIDYLDVNPEIVNMTLKDYLKREGELIFRQFGNHPSFVMFTLGNELGRNPAMYDLIAYFKDFDKRRLYAQGSNNMHWEPSFAEGDDFWVTCKTAKDLPVRGAFAPTSGIKNPHIDFVPPSTLHTYTKSIEGFDVPIVSHEIGAFQVSPDFREIPKFTGVTRARNYEIFRERLEKAKMLEQADDFVLASGKLAVICYREDIEAAIRTPDFAGFQLLDIQDFPGQGTAPVGILNDFLESKGLITPEEWSRFCCEVVPILKMAKYTWTNNELFKGEIEISHFGKEDFEQAEVSWKVKNSKGELYTSGKFTGLDIYRGGLVDIGNISFPLSATAEAEKLQVVISIEGTKYQNVYDIWVYPETLDNSIPAGVIVTESLDQETVRHLENGGKALIIPDHDKLEHCINGAFQTDYWCYPMFARGAIRNGIEPAPGSLGFICDPESPLLENFPTEFHSNWQWWHLVKNCKPIILDDTPAEYKPMIQTIDNFARNHKLGMVFETKYGDGNLLVCAIDLLNHQDKPEARQLYFSILNYMDSKEFNPQFELDKLLLKRLFE